MASIKSPEFCPLNNEDVGKKDNIENDDDDDGDTEEPVTVTKIHPAVVILLIVLRVVLLTGVECHLVVTPVDAVGNYEDAGTDPAEHSQNFDQHFLLYEGNGEETVKVGALAEHPGVVGDGEVGGEDV